MYWYILLHLCLIVHFAPPAGLQHVGADYYSHPCHYRACPGGQGTLCPYSADPSPVITGLVPVI